ncbi:MAG: GGDEF domain-containing protein, partial [Proteobacteria bacterium]|nr:GGDEF domain-containing protein [Pseudomonadota bacterium]
MKEQESLQASFEVFRHNLQNFIDISLLEDETSWMDWIDNVSRKIDVKCWEKKECKNEKCPAYKNSCGRCWIIAGTMLPGEAQCSFAKKYQSCRNCDVYQEAVYKNPIIEVEEYLIVLIHSLRSKQQELNLDANTDFLTKLHNRRFMDSYLHHEILKMKRDDTSRILMMVDVNGFKVINDVFGHQVGDQILVECADIIKTATRESELLSRYGGDEFVILLHENTAHDIAANAFIGRIEKLIAARNAKAGDEGPMISLSYGYTTLYSNNDIAEALAEADKNMYLDKAARKKNL